jgi:hypothetical protein
MPFFYRNDLFYRRKLLLYGEFSILREEARRGPR